MPKVSIVTPLYNGAKIFPETIDSVLRQDYENWEWILFDDGSSDGTQMIAKRLANDLKEKIFYFEHDGNKNYGTAYTRNRAVEKTNSELISFLDQDDIWYENRLTRHLEMFEKQNECSMIWGPVLYWYKERSFKQPIRFNGNDLKILYEPPDFVEIILSDLRLAPLPSATIVRKKNFNEVNGFEESIRGSEDIVFLVKFANKFRIYFDNEILVKHRKHQDSTLRQAAQSGIMNEWNLTFYKWIIDFLKKNYGKKQLIEDFEFSYYTCLKKISSKKNYFESRRNVIKGLSLYPELKEKFFKDYLLDLVMPFNIATKVSAKIRFDLFRK